MKIRTSLAVAGALLTAGAAAPAAMANSFTWNPGSGYATVSYDDGADRLCARLASGSVYTHMKVWLTPNVAGRGPSYSFTAYRGGGSVCRSLATAYEDSSYKVRTELWDRRWSKPLTNLSKNFYS